MPDVKTSTRLWSTECEMVDAACLPDHFEPGSTLVRRRQPYPFAYEFSNGKTIPDRQNPYETFADNT